jgi:regulator of sigma E protease
MSWLFVFAGLCFLIIVHEAGHFAAAKATGMRVERFFLFFGPTIWSFKRGETEYGIKSIPLGGYVKISGMNPEEELPPEVAHRAYCRQPVWRRIVVIGAGPAVNIALGLAILFTLALTNAVRDTQTVGEIVPKSPAATALRKGDKVITVDGRSYSNLDLKKRLERFGELVASHKCAGKQDDGCRASTPVKLKIERDGALRTISVRPEYEKALGRTRIGFAYGTEPVQLGVGGALDQATGFAWEVTRETGTRVAKIFESKERKEIHGIVGVSDVGHQIYGLGLVAALTFLAVISLSLGVINLLPFLPLDGGHIFWSLIEKLRGEPVPLRVMEGVSVVGFALVAMLFFIGLSNDIGQLTGEGFKVR